MQCCFSTCQREPLPEAATTPTEHSKSSAAKDPQIRVRTQGQTHKTKRFVDNRREGRMHRERYAPACRRTQGR